MLIPLEETAPALLVIILRLRAIRFDWSLPRADNRFHR
jgi:hypothetical protein